MRKPDWKTNTTSRWVELSQTRNRVPRETSCAIIVLLRGCKFLAHKTLRWEYEDGQLAQLQKDIELETGHVVCLDGQVYTEGGPKDFFDWNVHPTTTLEVCFYAWRLVVRLLSQQHLARSMLKLHMKHDRNAGAPNTNTTRVAHVKAKLERAGLFENPRDSPFWSYGRHDPPSKLITCLSDAAN